MATLRTTNLQHPSSVVPNLVLQADGTIGGEALSKFGLGGNVVQTVKTDVFSTTSASFVAVDDLEVTITPSKTDSKILLIATVNLSTNNTGNQAQIRLFRDGTGLSGDVHSFLRPAATNNIYSQNVTLLDSPETDSPVDYDVRLLAVGGITARINIRGDGQFTTTISSLTAIEVAG